MHKVHLKFSQQYSWNSLSSFLPVLSPSEPGPRHSAKTNSFRYKRQKNLWSNSGQQICKCNAINRIVSSYKLQIKFNSSVAPKFQMPYTSYHFIHEHFMGSYSNFKRKGPNPSNLQKTYGAQANNRFYVSISRMVFRNMNFFCLPSLFLCSTQNLAFPEHCQHS